jgi:uncharacterized protein
MSGTAQGPSAHLPRSACADTTLDAGGAQAPAEANRAAVRAAFEAWQAGMGAITSLFAADMVWRIKGRSTASKEYRNQQQFIDKVLAPFGGRFTASERFRPVRVRSVHADGDTVIVV